MSRPANSDRGTRREHLQRKQRKKPTPLWVQKSLKLGAIFGVSLIVLSIPTYLIKSGWVSQQVGRLQDSVIARTAKAGLVADNIFITGRTETAPGDVTLALGITKDQALLHFDPATARTQLEKLTWVKQARVERRFPNTVLVTLTERQPIGFYQKNEKLVLVDESATILATDGLNRWAGLPVLVGEGSPQAAPRIIEALQAHPDILHRVKALTLLNQRRWNLRLTNNVDVLLPEADPATALDRLQRAQDDSKVMDKDVLSIDLRQGDRMIVTPTPAAAARRTAPKQGI